MRSTRALLPALTLFLPFSQAIGQVHEGTATCSQNLVPICYGDHAECSIGAPSEIDRYRFQGVAGELIRITIGGKSINIDSAWEVIDAMGVTIEEGLCNTTTNGRCSTSSTFPLTGQGPYTLLVFDNGLNETGNYSLDLQRIPPTVPDRFIEFGIATSVGLGHIADHDFLTFFAEAGDLIRITAAGTINLDSAYRLYDPSGELVDSGFCNTTTNGTCSVQSGNLSLPLTGNYSLMIHDAGWNETGTSTVTVTCIVGTCPPNWLPTGVNYCTSVPNSTTMPATMRAWGSPIVGDETLFLYALDAPPNESGIFYMGQQPTSVPFGPATRCVDNPAYRFPVISSCNRGEFRWAVDFAGLPGNQQFIAGETWYFQAWFRDGATFQLSDGLEVLLQ